MSDERSVDVPTQEEFDALEARVTALEEAQGTVPPEPSAEGKQQPYVAVAGSGDWIIRTDSKRLDIDADGTIYYDSGAIPGSENSYAVGYDPSTNATYKQARARALWLYWGGSMTNANDWHTPSPPWTVPTTPPQPSGDLRSRMIAWIKGMVGQKVMIGQYCDSAGFGLVDAQAFTDSTGKHVALLGDGYWPFWGHAGNAGTAGRSVAQINADAIAHWQAGGIPYIQTSFPDPCGGDMYGTCTASEVITPGTAQYNKIHEYYDQEVAGLLALKAAGVVPLYRPYFENRWHFWWGFNNSAGWTAEQWVTLWRQHHDYLLSKGCDHLIWILSQYTNPHDGYNRGDTWPGDQYVDLQGEDVYTDNSSGYKGMKDGECGQHPNHPWAMAEWGSGSASAGNPNFDMRVLINDVKTSMHGTVIIQGWCGHANQWAWRLADMQHLPEAMDDPVCLVRENLNRPT